MSYNNKISYRTIMTNNCGDETIKKTESCK